MAYTFDQVFAADPSNPSNVAQNAAITIFAPGDGTMTPLTITDPDGAPLANPITVNANGFASAFAHDTLDRVAWAGGGFTGFFTSYEGMKAEATAARTAAETAAATAGADAAAVATAAIGTATDDAEAAAASAASAAASASIAATNASESATAATDAAALVGAPADTAIAAAVNGTGATKTALNATYVPKWKPSTAYTAGDAVLNPSGDKVTAKISFTSAATYSAADWNTRSTFHQPPSGGSAGISSYRVDNNGAWVSGQVVVKSATDNANRSVIDWSNVDPGTGYLLHLVAGSTMGGGLIGIGADGDTGTGIVVSAKGAMTGMGVTNTATSSGVGFAGGNFGTGLLVKLEKGNATAGCLMSLRGFAGGTNHIFKWRNAADTADLGWIEDGGAFNLAGSSGHRTKWDHGSGFSQKMYNFTGTAGLFWTTALTASSQSLLFQAGQSAGHAQGAETLTTLIEVKGGARLGFYGATPVTKPAAIASPAADVTALKTAVDALRTTLTSLGLTS